MRQRLSAVVPVLAWCLACGATEYVVSPTGNDANAGLGPDDTQALRTLPAAVERLKPGDTCRVRGGTYFLEETLVIGPERSGTPDAPIVIRPYGDGQPVLVGGRPVSGFVPYRGAILTADLGAQGLQASAVGVLVFAGQRQEMARYPSRNPADPHGGDWAYVDGERLGMYADRPDDEGYNETKRNLDFWQRNVPRFTRMLQMKEGDVRAWASPEQGEVSVFPRFNWSHYVLAIESFDPVRRMLQLAPGCFYEIRPGDRYFVRNLLEDLDQPGEWCVDRKAGRLYFWPPEPLTGQEVRVATLLNAVRLTGCAYVTVQGFTIECCAGPAVVLDGCTNVLLAGNTIRNTGGVGGYGVLVQGGQGNGVVGNDIHDTGSSGIKLGGGDPVALTPGANRADNNWIHHVGLVSRDAKGIELGGALNLASHNLIHDIPHYGILMWGSRHTIEYNHLRRTCMETEDAGGIGGGAIDWLSWQGAVIRYNRIEDTMGYGYDVQAGRWTSPYFTYALYPDWAASGVHIFGNLLIRAPVGCLHLHSGRDNLIENNVLIEGAQTQMEWNGWTTRTGFWSTMVDGWIKKYEAAAQHAAWQSVPSLKDPRRVPLPDGQVMQGNVFRRNIVCYRTPGASLLRFRTVPLDHNQADYNLYDHGGLPLRTGQSALKAESGPNLLANPGLEDGPEGVFPTGWAWTTKASEATRTAVVTDDQAHGGRRSLLVEPGPQAPGDKTGTPVYVAPGPAIPFQPGKSYRFSAWLRTIDGPGEVSVEAYSWKKDTHTWLVTARVAVTPEWREVEVLVRLPREDEPAYKPTMETLCARLTFQTGPTRYRVDDVSLREAELAEEWEAWQKAGMDTHSVVADPRFVDPDRGDYRLRPESPALKLGFQPIPMERIGCYADPLRASWPVGDPGGR
jgi:hypothetical protein